MSTAPLLGTPFHRFIRPQRAVHTVFIHCSATSNPKVDAEEIDRWHRERGYAGIGYHLFLRTDGVVEYGRSFELAPAAQAGYNAGTLAICVNGLVPADFNDLQMASLVDLCHEIDEAYPAGLRFRGHREVSTKTCPVFDYRKILRLSEAGMLPNRDPGHGTATAVPGLPVLSDATVSIPVTHRTARLGASGAEIRRLQVLLAAYSPVHPGAADGFFGPGVERSVRAFQRSQRLVDDGVVGPVTWEALERM